MQFLRYSSLLLGLCALISGTPTQHGNRQVTPIYKTSSAYELKAPYPAAGYRPRIPFELPNERHQPRVGFGPSVKPEFVPILTEEPIGTTPQEKPISTAELPEQPKIADVPLGAEIPQPNFEGVPTVAEASVEEPASEFDVDFGPVATTTPTTTINDFNLVVSAIGTTSTTTTEPLTLHELAGRTPANTYGTPDHKTSLEDETTTADTVEVTAELVPAPTRQLEPPTLQAAQDFYATTGPVDGAEHFNIAASSSSEELEQKTTPTDNQLDTMSKVSHKLTPAELYGAPDVQDARVPSQLPADIYGAPALGSAELSDEVTDAAVSASSEIEQLSNDGQYQVLSRFSDLKYGRLLFVPADGSSLRQVYFAELDKAPPSRNYRSERLMRF